MRGAEAYNPDWSKAEKLAYIMKLVSLLNVSGVDNKIISYIITDEEDPAMNPSVVNPSGGGFGAIGLMQVRQGSLNDVNRVYGPGAGCPILRFFLAKGGSGGIPPALFTKMEEVWELCAFPGCRLPRSCL